jgi:hypothetical protein
MEVDSKYSEEEFIEKILSGGLDNQVTEASLPGRIPQQAPELA